MSETPLPPCTVERSNSGGGDGLSHSFIVFPFDGVDYMPETDDEANVTSCTDGSMMFDVTRSSQERITNISG